MSAKARLRQFVWSRLAWLALLLVLVLLLAAGLPLEAGRPAPWPQASSDIPADAAVVWRTLPNGMRVALRPNHTPPGVVAMRLSVEFGSRNEGDDQRGLAHLIEHMAFNGTTHVAEGDMVARLERLGLAFGPDTNATTGREFTTYALDLPVNSTAAVDEGLFLLREVVSEVMFAPEALERERGVVLAEIRKGDTFERRRNEQELEFLIPGAAAIRQAPGGDAHTVQSASADGLRRLYRLFYRPDRTTLVVAGDIDADQLAARIASVFGDWTGAGPPPADPDAVYALQPRIPAAAVFSNPAGGDAISVFSLSPYRKIPDTWSAREDDMLVSVAVGLVNRRLAEITNREIAPFRAAGLAWSDLARAADFSSGSVAVTPQSWAPGLRTLEQEWRRARLHGFTQREIDHQVAIVRTALESLAGRQDTRASYDLASSLTASLQDGSVFSDPAALRARFALWAQTLTPERVRRAFDRKFRIDTPLIVMFSSAPRPPTEQDLLSVWRDSVTTKVTAPVQTPMPVFAYGDVGRAGRVTSDVFRQDIGARLIAFDNNVRLNLKHTDVQKGQVLVSLRIGRGAVAMERGPFGLSRLMGAYTAGGLERHSVDDLQTILAGHTVQAGFGASADAFGAVYATSPEDLHLQLQLAAAYLLHPGYRPEAERDWRQAIVMSWPSFDKTAQATFASRAARLLVSGDRRFGASPDDGVVLRSFTELKAALGAVLDRAPVEITIVGDINEQVAIDAVAVTFGALPGPRDAPRPVRSLIPVSFARDTIILHHQGEATQALLKAYWPVVFSPAENPRDVRVLGLLASVIRLRLLETVREKLGASYAPDAGFSYSSVYPGLDYLYAEAEVRPDVLADVRRTLHEVVSGLRSGHIAADDLERARRPALEQLSQHASSNGYWLSALAQIQGDPGQADLMNLSRVDALLRGVTVSDLSQAAQLWLRDDNIRWVEILPPEAPPAESASTVHP